MQKNDSSHFYVPIVFIDREHQDNRSFSYSIKKSESNDVMMHFEEFSNVHNSAYKIV